MNMIGKLPCDMPGCKEESDMNQMHLMLLRFVSNKNSET